MSPFKRLLGRKTALCECREHPAIKKLTLPNGLRIKVCSVCQDYIERLRSRPIDNAKLEAILNRIPVDKNGIWGFTWNSTPEEVISKSHPEIAKQLRSSKSSSLMSYYAGIEGETVKVSFHFADDGLREIMISPHGLLTDISQPLIERYGNEDKCRAYLEELRWPNGVACPRCGSMSISRIQKPRVFEFNSCRYQFSVTSGTIFHYSLMIL